MSTDADDRSSRLSDALDAIFTTGRAPDDDRGEGGGDAGGDGGGTDADDPAARLDDEPYELPEIVPATDAPRLPQRADPPEPSWSDPTDADVTTATGRPAGRVDDPAVTSPAVPTPASSPTPPPAAAPPVEAPVRATAWGDHMPAASPVTATPGVSQLRTPGRRPRVRRVTRVLRHIDPWSTFKVALLFSAVGYVVALTSGVLLWRVADSTGTLDNVERWFTQFGWETFELKGGEIFHNAWIIGLFGVVAATGAAVLLVTLFNLVSDIVGGIRMTVLEEEVVERTISSTRRYVVRTPPTDAVVGRGQGSASWSVDDDDRTDDTVRATDDRGAVEQRVERHVGTTTEVPAAPVEPTRQQPTADWSVD